MSKPTDIEYHRRNLMLPEHLAILVLDWHGGMGTALYSLGSTAIDNYVSPSMIDAGVDELKYDVEGVSSTESREELSDLISELEEVTSYGSGYRVRELGLGDIDSGWATWFMRNDDDWDNSASAILSVFGEAGLTRLGDDPELRKLLGSGKKRWHALAVTTDKLLAEGLPTISVPAAERVRDFATINPTRRSRKAPGRPYKGKGASMRSILARALR